MINIQYKKTGSLIPYINNARTHNAEQITQIAASIKEFGFLNPILLDSENGIIAGHGRLEAAKQLEIDQVPTIELSELSEAQKKAYILADNRLALNAGWDDELLKIELTSLDEMGADLSVIGFSEDELAAIFDTGIVEGLVDEDVIPETPKNITTKHGDIWLMGNHRLMCGDSTSIDSIKKLMDGQKATITFTSPPYNGDTNLTYGKGRSFDLYENDTDKWTSDQYIEFCHLVLDNIFKVTDGFIFWNVMYNSKSKYEYIKCIENNVEYLLETIVWKKTGMPIPHGLTRNYEFVFCFNNGNRKYLTQLHDGETNLWEISNQNCQADSIKACFPVGLPEKGIHMGSDVGDICFEPFGGSGTTLIACEKLKRVCRIMEKDPKYCDVIVKRWQDYTGKQAILERTGQKYDEVSNGQASTNGSKVSQKQSRQTTA